ncbi:MAG: diguanylate cyclase [Acidiferrobacterales bacterium]
MAEKLRKCIESHAFDTVGTVTASFGVAEFNRDEKSEVLIKRTDNALYEAKEHGRNKIVIAEDTLPSQENEQLRFTAG